MERRQFTREFKLEAIRLIKHAANIADVVYQAGADQMTVVTRFNSMR